MAQFPCLEIVGNPHSVIAVAAVAAAAVQAFFVSPFAIVDESVHLLTVSHL